MPMRGSTKDVPLPGELTTAAGTRADGSGGPVLSVERVRLGYWGNRGFHLAVEEASFDVAARERVIVIGQSGSGKSTLLKAVAGFLPPAAGAIHVAGRTSLAPGPDRAVVFQEFDQLFPWRTVLENVAYPLRVNGWRRKDAAARASEYLELTGLSHALRGELSGTGIKVSVVNPGSTRTEFAGGGRPLGPWVKRSEQVAATIVRTVRWPRRDVVAFPYRAGKLAEPFLGGLMDHFLGEMRRRQAPELGEGDRRAIDRD